VAIPPFGGGVMQSEMKEPWEILWEKASNEQDREKLSALINEIICLIAERQERLPT